MPLGDRFYSSLKGDRVIWMIVALLSLFSMLAVYSSTGTISYKYRGGNTEAYIIKHALIMIMAWGLMYFTCLIHYVKFMKWARYILIVAVVLLLSTLIFGVNLNDAKRWVTLPIIHISIQSSDVAKVGLIAYLAQTIASKQEYIKDFKEAFLPIIIPVLVICGLIAPANLSSAILLFLTSLLIMFMGRVDIKYIGLLILLGIVLFSVLIVIGTFIPELVRLDTWISRLRDFMGDSDSVYQVQQSQIAIAKGGLFGVGPGNSLQRNYLPHPYSDFIYAIIVEEYGLFGGGFIIFLYIMLLVRCVRLATLSPKAFGTMLAIGLSLSLVLQALFNMAVSVHLVPVTGLNLPMVSMGGTSLIITAIELGMILSVSKNIESS